MHGATMLGIVIVMNVFTLKNKINRIQELRRSNAATPIPSKKKYTRKKKHKNKYAE